MKSIDIYTGMRHITIHLDDKNFLYHAVHPEVKTSKPEEEIINDALDNPIDAKPLDSIPEGASVIVIIDDVTRPTPSAKIIPHILKRVEKRTKNIKFVTAPGTHRPLAARDLEAKIGREYMDKYGVVNIDYTKKDEYECYGDSNMGYPLHVHKAVLAADCKIAIGNIAPHNVVGWGGGAKILMPGVCGEETVAGTHLKGAEFPVMEVFGNIDCRMRREVDEIGGMIGLDFICNTILDDEKHVLALFCGNYLKAHRKGVEFAKQALCPAIPAPADIVIVSAYPSNIDYWQGFKPIGFSLPGVKKGGTIIYLFDPKEGLCNNSPAHKPMLEKYLKADKETVMKDLADGKITDVVGITNPLYHYQVLDHAKNVIVVTHGLTDGECELLSFTRAADIDEALRMAYEAQGEDAKVGIIPFGSETLVRL
jgi:lactate racemase